MQCARPPAYYYAAARSTCADESRAVGIGVAQSAEWGAPKKGKRAFVSPLAMLATCFPQARLKRRECRTCHLTCADAPPARPLRTAPSRLSSPPLSDLAPPCPLAPPAWPRARAPRVWSMGSAGRKKNPGRDEPSVVCLSCNLCANVVRAAARHARDASARGRGESRGGGEVGEKRVEAGSYDASGGAEYEG